MTVNAMTKSQHLVSHLTLFEGMSLILYQIRGDALPPFPKGHMPALILYHCRAGRIGWRFKDGAAIYLGAGDYALMPFEKHADAACTLPNDAFEGAALCLAIRAFDQNLPSLLSGTGVTGQALLQKYCAHGGCAFFQSDAQSASIFEGFYDQPEALRQAYCKLKALEALLCLYKRPPSGDKTPMGYQAEQVETIRSIHQYLNENLAQHVTIEHLAKQFLINKTTLKTVFKAVYGNSIAAHTREHRMERAAQLLTDTQQSIAQIALATGYESQSKFTAAFKDYYGLLPTQYRKQHCDKRASASPLSEPKTNL